MKVVRFKLKSDYVEKSFEVIDKTNFEVITQIYIAKIQLIIKIFLVSGKVQKLSPVLRLIMITHLNEMTGFIEEFFPELGDTDTLSLGILFIKLGIMIGSLPKLLALLLISYTHN